MARGKVTKMVDKANRGARPGPVVSVHARAVSRHRRPRLHRRLGHPPARRRGRPRRRPRPLLTTPIACRWCSASRRWRRCRWCALTSPTSTASSAPWPSTRSRTSSTWPRSRCRSAAPNPSLGARVNVVGTVNVLEAVARRSARMAPVVYASSIAAYDAADADADAETPTSTPAPPPLPAPIPVAACPGRSTASTSAPTRAPPRSTGPIARWPASGCAHTPSTGRDATRA